MGDLLEKFETLDALEQQQLLEYLDFLLAKRKNKVKKFEYQAYRKRIINIGTWPDTDLVPMEEARELVNKWRPQEW
ncbi:MAG: hypothetical protein ABMA02_13385 [Saprospiraceae bacterium]